MELLALAHTRYRLTPLWPLGQSSGEKVESSNAEPV